MRILHVLDHSVPLHSGYSFRTRAILEQQRALGWETVQLTGPKQHRAGVGEEDVDGFHFYRTPPLPAAWAGVPAARHLAVMESLTRRLTQVVPLVSPDVIHAHSPSLNGVAALRVGRRFGIPVVYEVRALWEDAAANHGTGREWGLRYRLSRALETYVLKHADAVTAICDGLKKEIVRRAIGAQVTVIPNAVDLDLFPGLRAPDPALAGQLKLDGKPVLGFIGSFYAYEGLSLLLEALPLIEAPAARPCLLLVGGGPEEKQLKCQARQLGIEEDTLFLGRIPHGEVHRYYDLIDVLVYPRLSIRLTELVTPLKPLEAMAQGALVVASDVGGHRELIRDGETGILFEPGNTEALAATISRLLQKPESWTSYRSKAREFVERERSWRASVERYREVYEGLASGAVS